MVFFFQAEAVIRDTSVTGVQTCALPIWRQARAGQPPGPAQAGPGGCPARAWRRGPDGRRGEGGGGGGGHPPPGRGTARSEERRVGRARRGGCGWWGWGGEGGGCGRRMSA